MSSDASQKIHIDSQTIAHYFMLFIAISFLGWILETIGCSIYEGGFSDRGFLTLPFCTIYGFTVLSIYGLLGTPDGGGVLLKKVKKRLVRAILYFLLAASFTVSVELVVGWFFTRICGISLWDYSAYRLNYRGYICLEFALIWGVLFLFGMKYLFEPIKRVVGMVSERALIGSSVILSVLLVIDWGIHYLRLLFG